MRELTLLGLDARPLEREPVRAETEVGEQRDVLAGSARSGRTRRRRARRIPMPGVCSHAHQSLFQLPPSTWCAAVAVPQRKLSGNEIAMGRHRKRPYTRRRMSVLDEILAAKRAELALLQESEARDTLRARRTRSRRRRATSPARCAVPTAASP